MNRLVALSKTTLLHNQSLKLVSKRNSSAYIGYREWNYEPTRPYRKLGAELCGGVMWWWIGWCLMVDWKHLVGEFPWPNRGEWTDEELGIPPQ